MTDVQFIANIGAENNRAKHAANVREILRQQFLRYGWTLDCARVGFVRKGQSARVTENTYVAAGTLHPIKNGAPRLYDALQGALYSASAIMGQDCIACEISRAGQRKGFLIGPLAFRWGAFDEKYFERSGALELVA